MARPFIQLGNAKIAPFKHEDNKPYGALINTTKAGEYPVKQDVMVDGRPVTFNWPSSEHAYHAQKLIHLMNKNPGDKGMQMIILQTLRRIEITKAGPGDEFLPDKDWGGPKGIVESLTKNYPRLFGADKKAFDALCDSNYHSLGNPNGGLMTNGEPYTLKFMRDVVKLKLEQHPELKQLAMDCARDGILPMEVSRFDDNWASGPDGKGANMLGTLILELGNEYLRKEEPQTPIKIPNPKAYYQQLQQQAATPLRHDSLVPYTQSMQGWQQNVTPMKHQTSTHGATTIQATSQQKAHYQSPAHYVQSKLAHTGCTDVNVVPDLNNPSLKVVQLKFRNAQEASAFKQQHSGADTRQNGNTLTLGPVRAPLVFQKFGIEYYGIHNRRSTMQALIDSSQPTAPNSLGNAPPKQTSGKQTPFEYVRDKIGCAEVRVVPDKSNPSQKVVQLVFKNIQEATNFKTHYSGSTTPQEGRILTLGPTRAENVFEKFNIKEYGRKHPRPTMQALVDFSQTVSPQSTIVRSPNHTSSTPTPAKETPTDYVKRKLDSLHSGCNSVRVVPDARRPSQQVVQLVFDDAQKAAKFKAQYSGVKTPTSADGKTLTLGANRAPQVFKNLEIEYYGRKHPRPTSQALIEEHQRKLGASNSPTPISSPSSRDSPPRVGYRSINSCATFE